MLQLNPIIINKVVGEVPRLALTLTACALRVRNVRIIFKKSIEFQMDADGSG